MCAEIFLLFKKIVNVTKSGKRIEKLALKCLTRGSIKSATKRAYYDQKLCASKQDKPLRSEAKVENEHSKNVIIFHFSLEIGFCTRPDLKEPTFILVSTAASV